MAADDGARTGGGEWPDPDGPARSPEPGSATTDHEVDDDDLPGTSRGPRPRLGDFGASEAEQRRTVGRPER